MKFSANIIKVKLTWQCKSLGKCDRCCHKQAGTPPDIHMALLDPGFKKTNKEISLQQHKAYKSN